MLSSIVAVLCAVFGLCAVLIVHMWCTDHYRSEMRKIDEQVKSIQWPVQSDNHRRM